MYLSTTAKRGMIVATASLVAIVGVVALNQPGTRATSQAISGNPEPVVRNPEPAGVVGNSPTVYARSPFEPSFPATAAAEPIAAAPLQPVMEATPPMTTKVAYRAPVRRRRASNRRVYYSRRRYRRGRPFSHSAAIVGGSAAGGAIIGGLAGGGKGAGIGALAGGAAGLVYDRATHKK